MKIDNKPKVIIFEGIATTGKTTSISNLLAYFKDKEKVVFISEEETFIPLFENKNPDKARDHLRKIIKRLKKIKKGVLKYIIVERLFLSHAFRTKSQTGVFSDLEKELKDFCYPIIILLTMKNECIEGRIKLADVQRGNLWKHKKIGTITERVIYYRNQQEYIKNLSSKSLAPVFTFDTSNMNWSKILKDILKKIEI